MVEKNNWLICGTSPFAMAHLDAINYSDFTTVGLNSFPVKCNYRFFVDYRLICCYTKEDEKLVIPKDLIPELKYYNHVGRECLRIVPHFTYTIGNELSCINSVCEPAIEYAYKQGADNIILFGVDLTTDWQPKEQTDVTKAIISKYGNVYTLNKEANIGVPTWTEINLK
jgi:hypothetical protein